MKIVVKIGGVALEDKDTLQKCARAVVDLARDGHKIALVHGGGSTLTRTLKLLGKKSDFVNGLRITDAETRDVALMVLAGIVNKSVVAAVVAAGNPAIGLCGGDGMSFRARKKQTEGYDLGFVGEICSVEPRWLEAIWQLNGVPVLCSLALGFDGEYYNVNADEMAAACAVACGADALVFLTDVPGVKDANGAVLRWLSIDQIAEMAKSAVITGGMLPKLGACREALLNGVKRVRILPAEAAGSLPDLCSTRVAHGTEVMVA